MKFVVFAYGMYFSHLKLIFKNIIKVTVLRSNVILNYSENVSLSIIHGKINFAKGSKNLAIYRSKNIFVIDHQNNYVNDDAAKSFNIMTSSLNVLHNYFDGPNKIIFISIFQQNRSFHVLDSYYNKLFSVLIITKKFLLLSLRSFTLESFKTTIRFFQSFRARVA